MQYRIWSFIGISLLVFFQSNFTMNQKDQVARISPEVLAYIAQHYQNRDTWMTYGGFSSTSSASSSSVQATKSAAEYKYSAGKSVKLYDDILVRLGVDIRIAIRCAGSLSKPCLISDLFDSLADMFKKNHEASAQQWRKLMVDRAAWGAVVRVNPDNFGFSSTGLDNSYEYVYHMHYENGIIEHICYESDGQSYRAILEMDGLEPIVIARRVEGGVVVNSESKQDEGQCEHKVEATSASSSSGSHAPMIRTIGQREELEALCDQATEVRVCVLNNADRVYMELKDFGGSLIASVNTPIQMIQSPSNSRIIDLTIGGDNS